MGGGDKNPHPQQFCTMMAATFLPIITQKGINALILSFLLPPELASLYLVGKFAGGCDNDCEETIPQIGARAAMECCTDKHGILFQRDPRDNSITILAQEFCHSDRFASHMDIYQYWDESRNAWGRNIPWHKFCCRWVFHDACSGDWD